jgi:hypothetical protein
MPTPVNLTKDYDPRALRHMLEYGGVSYRPDRETFEQGRYRCALELARAEMRLQRSPASVYWRRDHDADVSWMDADARAEFEAGDAVMVEAILHAPNGDVIGSLHGIHLLQPWREQGYRRVIEAELAEEAGTLLDPSEEEREASYWLARGVMTNA